MAAPPQDNLFESDERFHFAPGPSTWLHQNMISPMYRWQLPTKPSLPSELFVDLQADERNNRGEFSFDEGPSDAAQMPRSADMSALNPHFGCVVPPPRSSMEAYLLLEAARSDRVISRMRKDLAYEIVHRNTIALQLNRLTLENAQDDFQAAGELVGHVRFTIRKSGYSVAQEHVVLLQLRLLAGA